ncbi:hypothetical protein QOZ80_2AG0119030 [Eleusine coracana subsp. coracana]|nr:hypothetical protein QOZ80_2AG0119030 [Eleusine coracana subsp. coracana]
MSSCHAPQAVANPTPVHPHRRRQPDVFIRSVTAATLAADLATIRSLLPQHPFVTVHAEYPGCDDGRHNLNLPPGVREEDLSPAARYALAKIDIDALPLLQLGITICGPGGRLPLQPGPLGPVQTVWQIGFQGNPDGRQDLSLRALAATLFAARIVAAENLNKVTWVSFGGLYHFGFLLKVLTGGMPLPDTRQEFSAMLAAYLGRNVFDARYIAAKLPMGVSMDGDLMATAKLVDAPIVAEATEVSQAGEKSLAACQVFMRTTALFFAWHGVGSYASRIHGLH